MASNDCHHDWHAAVHLQLLAKRGFHLFRPLHLGEMLFNACCESGRHRAHCQRSRARPRLLVSTAGSARNKELLHAHATTEHLRVPDAAMSAIPFCFIHMQCSQSCHAQQRSSIDEALLGGATAGIVHHCCAHATADTRPLAGVSQARESLSLARPALPSPKVDACTQP